MTAAVPLVAGNWKMHTTSEEAARLVREILALLPDQPEAEVLVLPPYTSIPAVHKVLGGERRVRLGAQNCHWEESGAVTGEVSAPMLKEFCDYILVGHSERRSLFGESDATVRAKLGAVLRSGMRPILAVGETREERDAGLTRPVLERQARAGLSGLSRAQVLLCTVAYEPVWAIGAGVSAEPGDISAAASILRAVIGAAAQGTSGEVRILYGGSVTAESAPALLAAPGIAGALVGGASLSASDFCGIVAAAGA